MAGNRPGDNSGNILVDFDYNNIIVVDPNKTIDAFGNIAERLVDHENLVMFANLEAEVTPRTKLAVGTTSTDGLRTISIAKINFLKPNKNRKGYLNLKLCKKSDGVCSEKSVLVHRLVANEFLDNTLNKPQVNHKNGIKDDNRVENLEWATGSENVIHALANNLKISIKGSEHRNSKLTEKEVLEIRAIGRTKTLKEVAEMYNVDMSLISLILLEKAWKHLL
jgi:hypothetical protein